MEEVTTENIIQLILKLPKGCTPLERAILVNEGTVQTFLSVIFQNPIYVKVICQDEFETYFNRKANLLMKVNQSEVVVYSADSIIYKNKSGKYSGFYTGISEKKMGIGQLLSSLLIQTTRDLCSFDITPDRLIRTYRISDIDKDIDIRITETFIRRLFKNRNISLLKGDLNIPVTKKSNKSERTKELIIKMGIQ